MIRIVTLSNPRMAQAFVDFMVTQNIILEVRHQGRSEVELWLLEDSRLNDVEQQLTLFLQDPSHPRYLAASWRTGNTTSHLPATHYSYFARIRSQAGPLTLTILVLCSVIYFFMQLLGDEVVMDYLAWPADRSQYWQLWRWVSHAFLHFSPLHILFNLLWWWYLGGMVEKRLGTGKLLVISLVAAIFSGWAQSHYSGIYFGGLSGVVYALMGYVWLLGELAPKVGLLLPRGLIAFSIVWLLAGYFPLFGFSLANAAHIAGLIIGLLMAGVDSRKMRSAH